MNFQIALCTLNHVCMLMIHNLTFASNKMKDIELYLKEDLANVNQWLIANKLTLNQSKTQFMLTGSRQRLCKFQSAPNLTVSGTPIKQVPEAKSLDAYACGCREQGWRSGESTRLQCGLSLLLFRSLVREVFPRVLRFSLSSKTSTFEFQFDPKCSNASYISLWLGGLGNHSSHYRA